MQSPNPRVPVGLAVTCGVLRLQGPVADVGVMSPHNRPGPRALSNIRRAAIEKNLPVHRRARLSGPNT